MEDDVRVGTSPYNTHNIHYPVARTASPGMLPLAFCSQGSHAATATNPQMPLGMEYKICPAHHFLS